MLIPVLNAQRIEKNLTQANKYLHQGSYDLARKKLIKVVHESKGTLGLKPLIQLYISTGSYERALLLARKMSKRNESLIPGQLAIGKICMLIGRYSEARMAFLEAYSLNPESIQCQGAMGSYYYLTGDKKKYIRYFSKIFDQYDPDMQYSAEDLTAIAHACRIYALKSDEVDRSDTLKTIVQEVLPLAIKQKPYYLPAYQEMSEIFLDAFNTLEAGKILSEALKINPNDPEILFCYALYHLRRPYCEARVKKDFRIKAINSLRHALEINPRFIKALDALSFLTLADEEYKKTQATIEKALAVNPKSLSTLSIQAGIYLLKNRTVAFEQQCQKILNLNPIYGELYYTVAQIIRHKRRFDDSVTMLRKSIKMDPFFWHAYIDLATNLMHTGEIEEAKSYFEKLAQEYNFHTQSHNTLLLLMKYKEFKLTRIKNFKIRLHISDNKVLLPLVERTLTKAFKTLRKRYRFTPLTPILFEMFPTHEDFSVRTVGLDSLGASGACFGKVVVEVSPQSRKLGNFNWTSVAWHELAHVFTLQMTNYQVPRWFTEGISEYTEKCRNPACQRKLDLPLYSIFSSGRMRKMVDLNAGFTRPTYPLEVSICYYQATFICQLIADCYGFDKILAMLELYKQGKKDREVFQIVLGVSLEKFDEIFAAWLQKHVFAHMDVLPSVSRNELEDLKDAAEENPEDIDNYIKLAIGHLQLRKFADAEIYAGQVLKLAPEKAVSYNILGQIAYRKGNIAVTKKMLEKAIALGSKNFKANLILGRIYWRQLKNAQQAIHYFKQAKQSFARYVGRGNPYQSLAKIYRKLHQKDKALAELDEYFKLAGEDSKTRVKVAQEYYQMKNYSRSLRLLGEAEEIYPFDVELQYWLAKLSQTTHRWKNAIEHYKTVLFLKSKKKNKHQIHLEMAKVYLALKDLSSARFHVQKALALKKNFGAAKRFLSKLNQEKKSVKLVITVYDTEDPVLAGEDTIYVVTIENKGKSILHDIQLSSDITKNLRYNYIKGPAQYVCSISQVKFTAIKTLSPDKKILFMFCCQTISAGKAKNIITVHCQESLFPVTKEESTAIY